MQGESLSQALAGVRRRGLGAHAPQRRMGGHRLEPGDRPCKSKRRQKWVKLKFIAGAALREPQERVAQVARVGGLKIKRRQILRAGVDEIWMIDEDQTG